jgi:hypothetical protein
LITVTVSPSFRTWPTLSRISAECSIASPGCHSWPHSGQISSVGLYLGADYTFAGHVEAIADIAGNLSGALSAGAVTLGFVLVLRSASPATDGHQ